MTECIFCGRATPFDTCDECIAEQLCEVCDGRYTREEWETRHSLSDERECHARCCPDCANTPRRLPWKQAAKKWRTRAAEGDRIRESYRAELERIAALDPREDRVLLAIIIAQKALS